MNILGKLAQKSMKANRTRTVVTIIGILLSAALFSAVTTLAFSIRAYLIDLQVYHGGDYHVACHQADDRRAAAIREDADLTMVAEARVLGMVNLQDGESGVNSSVLMACNDAYFAAMPVRVAEGRLPAAGGEAVLSRYWYEALPLFGYEVGLGKTVTLPVTPRVETVGAGDPSAPEAERTFTIVGVLEEEFSYRTFYSDYNFLTVYTYDDGQGQALYSDLYLKGKSPYAAFSIAEKYGGKENTLLLGYYGAAKSSAEQVLLLAGAAALLGIVMIGTSGLIHNAFSVSLFQRTQEFGILSGVGATAKQLRESVRHEAWMLCLLGIPGGLLIGYGGTALLLLLVGDAIEGLLPVAAQGVALKARLHPAALAGAAAIAGATVFLSLRKPLRAVKKISPITAIRQNGEYAVDGKTSGKIGTRGDISVALARKYDGVSRKKFRRTVFSLSMSILLFLLAAAVSGQFREFAASRLAEENFDFWVAHPGGEPELLARAVAHESISRKAACSSKAGYMALPRSGWSGDGLEAERLSEEAGMKYGSAGDLAVYYLEDGVLKAYLLAQGIDPAPYLRTEDPLALVCEKRLTTPYLLQEDGTWKQYRLRFSPLAENVDSLRMLAPGLPEALREHLEKQYPGEDCWFSCAVEAGEAGEVFYIVTVKRLVEAGETAGLQTCGEARFLLRTEARQDGGGTDRFYPVAKDGSVGKTPVATAESTARRLPLGARIGELPFGVPSEAEDYSCSRVALILPLSAAEAPHISYAVRTEDYLATKRHLDSLAGGNIVYNDYLAEQYQSRSTAMMIDVFAFTFLTLITTICAANVFNTVSSGIALRRRDFGILKSLGMTEGQLGKMVAAECLTCGWRALLWSVPPGVLLSIGIRWAAGSAFRLEGAVSWQTLLICVLCAGITVGLSMAYALRKVRRGTPMEAIRAENI